MEQEIKALTLIDLISEKHIILRKSIEDRWQATQEEAISHTEGLLLAKLYMGKTSLAEVARQANISRQAMYKCAKQLEARGYLTFTTNEAKAKYAVLTKKGERYYHKSQLLKQEIEKEIEEVLGTQLMEHLKETLKSDWKVI